MTDTAEDKREIRKITQKIIGYRVKTEETPEPIVDTPIVQPLTKLERGEVLYGATYKVKQPALPDAYEHGFYVTINSTSVNGELKPFELFIETKNIEALPAINILSFTLTTLFRQQIDITHLLEEYRSIQVGGGYRGKKHFWQEKPKFYNSFWGEIADVIEYHLGTLFNTAVLNEESRNFMAMIEEPNIDVPHFPSTKEIVNSINEEIETELPKSKPSKSAGICPSCQSEHTALLDNCLTCLDCSYSKCG